MPSLEQMQQDIQALPEEAQLLLMDFIEILKKRYPQRDQASTPTDVELAEPSFAKVWDNPEDAAYDALTSSTAPSIDRRAFMKLPMAERQLILAAQAEAMSEHYEQNAEWQEWVNLDVEATYDES